MSKIAPVTMALLADLRAKVRPGKDGDGDAQVLRIVEAEVMALRAVARAARVELKFNHPCRDDWEPCVLCRALSRLSRASRAGRGKP